MPVQPDEVELGVHGVVAAGVELLERLHAGQEEVHGHRVGHQLGDFPDGGVLDLQPGRPPEDLQEDHQHRRPGAERRGQESRRQDGRVPVRAGPPCRVDARRHGVDAHRERDRDDDQRPEESCG